MTTTSAVLPGTENMSAIEKLKLCESIRAMYVQMVGNTKQQLYPKELRELDEEIRLTRLHLGLPEKPNANLS